MKQHNLNVNLSSSGNDIGNVKALSAFASFSLPKWIFDSGATLHMVAHKNLFFPLIHAI
jgi:hypothetical protein